MLNTTHADELPFHRKYPVLLFLALTGAGLAGNYLRYEVFFDIQFIFGSIFAMLALQYFGLRLGVLAAERPYRTLLHDQGPGERHRTRSLHVQGDH